ncbi:hypothetical protein JCM3774_006837 [Rhodotorula dairenensis]
MFDAMIPAGVDAPDLRTRQGSEDDPADVRSQERAGDSAGHFGGAFEVRSGGMRPRLRWLRPVRASSATAGRSTPKRSQTRLVPLLTDANVNTNPLEAPRFLEGLKSAGYLQPLDVSRKAIKSRFMHGLKKEDFQANLEAFLEEHQLKARGEFMVRFRGSATEAHSPFVHLFATALPLTSANSCKVLPKGATSSSATTWTPLADTSEAGSSNWACKARRFWPVRVCLEGPEAATLLPAAATPSTDGRPARRKRRDTFQHEVDLDAEIREREKQEAFELLKNTDANAVPLGGAASLQIRTTKLEAPATVSEEVSKNSEQAQSPSTPTILESVRQLGQSVAANWGPAVQQLPGAVNKSIHELRDWFAQRQLPSPFEAEVEAEEEARERRRREKRRRHRARERERREREEVALAAAKRGLPMSGDSREDRRPERGESDHDAEVSDSSERRHRRRHRREKRQHARDRPQFEPETALE